MSNLTKIDPDAVQMFSSIAQSLAKSGFFPIGGQYQARTPEEQAAQAFVKIMAGHELGIGPVLAMQHIHIIDGKTSLDATMVAGLIKSSGKYDYDVDEMTAKGCAITFYQTDGGQRRRLGTATWGEADARSAGLLGRGNWGKYPRDMFFSRCVTFGARRFCPDVFLGPIYTPEELGSDIPPTEDTDHVAAPVQTLALGDGHTTTGAPVAQLTAPATPAPSQPAQTWAQKIEAAIAYLDNAAGMDDETWGHVANRTGSRIGDWPEPHRAEVEKHISAIRQQRGEQLEPAGPDVGDGDNMP